MIIKLPFAGIKGQDTNKRVEVQVPCTEMWKPKSCPVTAAISPWWKDDALIDLARTYYRKKSFLYQGFVTVNPIKDDVVPENPIRRFIINPGIHDIIKGILMSQDLENNPTDYDGGRDFRLTKTQKGQHANYSTSTWAMKERPLSDEERAAIDKFGLFNLNDFLPKKPDDAHLKVIMEMFEASVDGELYDPDRWVEFYRPFGVKLEGATEEATSSPIAASVPAAKAPVTASVTEDEEPPFEPDEKPAAKTTAKTMTPEEILAMVRNRQQSR